MHARPIAGGRALWHGQRLSSVDSMTLERAESPSAGIEVVGLTKRFGRLTAVDSLDGTVDRGEIVGFLGPNGAGKTTTMRLLMGFLRPTSGRCALLGASPTSDVRLRSRVGYLPGDVRVDPSTTARDLLRLYAELRGVRGTRRSDELVERLDLDPTRPFRTLSKGNRQKVGIVQAFFHEPDVLLLDEPTSGLDPLVQREFFAMVRDAAARGAAVLFSSHVLPEVEHLAARVMIIRSGRLVTTAPVQELLDRSRHQVQVRFAGPVSPALFDGVEGVGEVLRDGPDTLTLTIDGAVGPALRAALAGPEVLRVAPSGDDLEDLFIALYGSGDVAPGAAGGPRHREAAR